VDPVEIAVEEVGAGRRAGVVDEERDVKDAVKVSKQQSAQNRRALVEADGRLFRERGIDVVGVAEICQQAGLTHGALYAQFPSKEALAAEALADNLQRKHEQMTAPIKGREPTLIDHLDYYLSSYHRDHLAEGCAMAASASEIARQGDAISAGFTAGFVGLVDVVERSLGDGGSAADRRQRALAVVAAMIGGIAAARATAKADPALSDDILVSLRRVLDELGGAKGQTLAH
jgi:TetR/AcrR family transcriptional regulator, transcriptional repressor for nem operon